MEERRQKRMKAMLLSVCVLFDVYQCDTVVWCAFFCLP